MAPQRTAKLGEPSPETPATVGPETEGAPDGPVAGDGGLFAAAGPFEHYPGAVLLAGRGGRVLGATASAQALARELASGSARGLDAALTAALAGKAAQINPFVLTAGAPDAPGAPGGRAAQAYDLTALPWRTGESALVIARDITVERSLRAALIESRERYKDLVEACSDFAWETDAEGRFTFVSPRGVAGYAAGQLVGQSAEDFLLQGEAGAGSPFATRAPIEGIEIRLRGADEEAACFSVAAVPLTGADGAWCGARGVCRDVTRDRDRAAELARSHHREALLGYILRIVRDELDPAAMLKAAAGAMRPALSVRGVAIFRRQGGERFARMAQSGRLPEAQRIAPLLARVLAGEDEVAACVDRGRLLIKATRVEAQANGALCLWRDDHRRGNDAENAILLAEIAAQIGVANEQLSRERQMERQSSIDAVTGLLNRPGFVGSLASRFARAGDRDQASALFAIGLDAAGADQDQVLADFAVLLKQQTRAVDLAARFGGAEFTLFLAGIDAENARRKAAALLAAAGSLRRRKGCEATAVGLSIGVAFYDPATPEAVEALIGRADRALRAAAPAGEGAVRFAEPAAG